MTRPSVPLREILYRSKMEQKRKLRDFRITRSVLVCDAYSETCFPPQKCPEPVYFAAQRKNTMLCAEHYKAFLLLARENRQTVQQILGEYNAFIESAEVFTCETVDILLAFDDDEYFTTISTSPEC